MFFVFRCYLLPLGAMTLYVLNVPKRPCKITTFPQTRKGMEEIQLQCIGIGCLFLHELPLMYHELSLIVCFTRISINVPGIVINCFGLLHQGADGSSSHVMPTFDRPYGAGLPHHTPSRQRTTPPPLAVMADKDPPSLTPLGLTLVVASRHREEERRSDPFMPDSCKI